MKTLLIILLLSLNLFAQEVIPVSRGTGRYTFTPITGSYVDSYDILRLEGNYTRAKNINGATSCKHFMVFKYTGGVYDSLETITWNVEDPIADTPGTYYSSGLYKMKNNSWVYAKGDEETFQTELKPPIIASIQSSNLCLNLTFGKNAEAESDSMVLQRDTISGSTWTDVSWLDVNEHTYKDTGGLFYNGGYKYRLANYRHNRYYSSISTAKVINPNPPLTLSDDPFVVVMDSTGTVVGASYSRALVSIDFEDGDTSDIGTVTSAGTGTALSSGTGYKYIGDRGAKMILGTTDPNIYGVKTFAEQDTIWGAFYIRFDASINTSNTGTNAMFSIFSLWDGGNDLFYFGGKTNGSSDLNTWYLETVDNGDSTYLTGNSTMVADTWYKIEWQFIGNQSGATGGVKIWLNDNATPLFNVSRHSNSGVLPDRQRYGWNSVYSNIQFGDANSFIYVDDCVLAGGLQTENFVGFTSPIPPDSTVTLTLYANDGNVTIKRFTYDVLPAWVTVDTTGFPKTILNGAHLHIDFTFDRDQDDTTGTGVISFVKTIDTKTLNYTFQIIGDGFLISPDITPPSAPTNLVATGYNVPGAIPKTYANITWVESVSLDKDTLHLWATPINNILGSYSLLVNLLEGTTSYKDTLVEATNTRAYKITQEDDSSNVSAYSNSDSALVPANYVPPSPPATPSNLVSIGDTLAIHSTWDDNSSNETAFYYYRNNVKVATLPANTEAYTDTPLVANTTYQHKISAYNSTGGESSFSNVTTTITSNSQSQIKVYGVHSKFAGLTSTGTGSGNSWANKKALSSWTSAQLSPGDTLVIDGGVDSIRYQFKWTVPGNGNANNLLVFRHALSWDVQHRGRVIFDGNNYALSGYAIYLTGKKYVRLEGVEIQYYNGGAVEIRGTNSSVWSNVVYLDSCIFRNNKGYCLYVQGYGATDRQYHDSTFIRYNTLSNLFSSSINVEIDQIVAQACRNLFIIGNDIRLLNNNPSTPQHNDCIAVVYNTTGVENLYIIGNKLINLNSTDVRGQTMIFESLMGLVVIYNNVISTPNYYGNATQAWGSTVGFWNNPTRTTQYYLYNNTWDFGKAGDQPNKGLFVRTGFAADTTFHIKNNLFYSSEQMRQKQIDFDESSGTRLITWSYVDGNAWGSLCDYNNDLLNVTGNTGTPFTMAELNAKGAELSGAPANRWNKVPIFVNYGLYDYRQQSNSPYYNVGANIQAEVEKVLPVGIPYAPIYGTKVTP